MLSIIIPTFNSESTIKRTVQSALNQSRHDIEILIIDNGSSDNTNEIISELAEQDKRIRILISPRGRSNARNYGIENASGKYLQFLDSDDEIGRLKADRAINFLETNPKYDAFITNTIYINDNDGKKEVIQSKERYHNAILSSNFIPINAPIFRNRNIIKFDVEIDYNEDWYFWVLNFWNKEIYWSNFSSSEGSAIVHITGSNTMKDIDTMRIYREYVRAKIKEKIKFRSLRLFFSDIKSMIVYYLVGGAHFIHNDYVESQLKFESLIANILLKIRPIKKRFLSKLQYSNQNSRYL